MAKEKSKTLQDGVSVTESYKKSAKLLDEAALRLRESAKFHVSGKHDQERESFNKANENCKLSRDISREIEEQREVTL